MGRKLHHFCLFAMLMIAPSLYGQNNHVAGQEEQVEVDQIDPTALSADWLIYFDVEQPLLEERLQEIQTLLTSLLSSIEDPEAKATAEKQINEFNSYLHSLIQLKKQELEKPNLAWLPKLSYTLDDFLAISDSIRSLSREISQKKSNLEQQVYSLNELRQNLNTAYAKYLSLKAHTQKQFKEGLRIISLGARLLYHKGKIELDQAQIKSDQQLLERYKEEWNFVTKEATLKISQEAFEGEKEKIINELKTLEASLRGFEEPSLETHSLEMQKSPEIISLELNNTLIREALVRARLFFVEAKSSLYKAIHSPDKVIYSDDVEPIRTFQTNTAKQLRLWERAASRQIDQLSRAFVKENGEGTEEWTTSYEEALRLSLSNRAFLDTLSKELYHIKLVLDLIDQEIKERQPPVERFSYTIQSAWQTFTGLFGGWLYYSLFEIGGVPVTPIGLLKALLIIFAAFLFSRFLGRAIKKLSKGRVVPPTLYTFRRIIHYLILLIGIIIALASLGITMRNLAIVLGALGIGIGFGLQNIVNNFLSGLAILFERNVKIGDFVELESGDIGQITEVNVQSTSIHTFDGLDILIPNSAVISNKVINWTKKDSNIRVHIPFCTAYGTDLDKISQVVCEVAKNVSFTARGAFPDPETWLIEFGESSLNFELVVWVNVFRGRRAIRAAYLSAIEKAFKEHGIHIPFPQRDLHLKTFPVEGIPINKK